MRKYIFVFSALIAFALLAFAFSPALANAVIQAVTATPTFVPPSVTPTTIYKTCPVGTPAGWGTYTPSPLWALECSQCAIITTPTSTASPTATALYYGTGTPPVGCTPSAPSGVGTPVSCAYATVTSVPTALPAQTLIPNNFGIVLGTCQRPYSFSPSSATSSVTNYNNGYRIDFSFVQSSSDYQNNCISYDFTGVGAGSIKYFTVDATASGKFVAAFPDLLSGSWSTGWDGYGLGHLVKDFTRTGTNITIYSAGNGSNSVIGSIYVMPQPIIGTPFAVVPSPTATPYFDVGYCSSVAPVDTDFGFDLFVPDGVANCDIGWDAITLGENEFPAVQICLQPSSFGVIKMFGEDYEIGFIALAVAAAFIYRFVRTV